MLTRLNTVAAIDAPGLNAQWLSQQPLSLSAMFALIPVNALMPASLLVVARPLPSLAVLFAIAALTLAIVPIPASLLDVARLLLNLVI
jgi:hypothetical protein